MPYVDLDEEYEENEVQEHKAEKQDNAIERLATAILHLAGTKVDQTIFDNFWLSELKSIDDSIRALTNINILIISAFLTIILANFTAISDHIRSSFGIDSTFFALMLIIPIFSWGLALMILIKNNHRLPPYDALPLLYDKEKLKYLKYIYKYKLGILSDGYISTFDGLVYINFIYFIDRIFESQEQKYIAYIIVTSITILFVFLIGLTNALRPSPLWGLIEDDIEKDRK